MRNVIAWVGSVGVAIFMAGLVLYRTSKQIPPVDNVSINVPEGSVEVLPSPVENASYYGANDTQNYLTEEQFYRFLKANPNLNPPPIE